jgi:hypothetical protein
MAKKKADSVVDYLSKLNEFQGKIAPVVIWVFLGKQCGRKNFIWVLVIKKSFLLKPYMHSSFDHRT